jgi:transcriptional regulator with XRE-family HTH domain
MVEGCGWEGAERVSDFSSSAVRRLANELRRLRRRAHLTGKDVATQLGWSEAKLSRIENGLARVKSSDLAEFLDLYQVSGPSRAELEALAEESRQTDELEELEGDLPEWHAEFMKAERAAETMWDWEPQVVPGLLQIADYTRAILRPWPDKLAVPEAEIERRVETRLLRQRNLTRDPPLKAAFVVDQSVLLRNFAAPSVMRDQLAHLAELSEHPNIELQILALDGDQVIGTGAFVYFKFPRVHGVPLPDVVAFEHLQGTTFSDSEQDVHTYQTVFKALREASLSLQASRDTLTRMVREAWQ